MFLLMLCFFILAESGVCRLIFFFSFSIFSCYLFRSVFSAANEKQFTFEHRHILYWCVLFAAARSTSTPDNISEKHFDSEIHSNTIWYLCSNSLRIWQAKSEKKRQQKNIASYVIYVMLLQRPDQEGCDGGTLTMAKAICCCYFFERL